MPSRPGSRKTKHATIESLKAHRHWGHTGWNKPSGCNPCKAGNQLSYQHTLKAKAHLSEGERHSGISMLRYYSRALNRPCYRSSSMWSLEEKVKNLDKGKTMLEKAPCSPFRHGPSTYGTKTRRVCARAHLEQGSWNKLHQGPGWSVVTELSGTWPSNAISVMYSGRKLTLQLWTSCCWAAGFLLDTAAFWEAAMVCVAAAAACLAATWRGERQEVSQALSVPPALISAPPAEGLVRRAARVRKGAPGPDSAFWRASSNNALLSPCGLQSLGQAIKTGTLGSSSSSVHLSLSKR